MEPEKWYAPFTVDQVICLSGSQTHPDGHPYVCWSDPFHRLLVPARHGLVCEDCGYVQEWADATPDPYGLVGLSPDEYVAKILGIRWYVQQEDLIGGWCIMPVPLPPSRGYREIAIFVGREEAEHIVFLHNFSIYEEAERW